MTANGGPAVRLNTVTASLPFQQITSTSSATTGVALNSLLGSFSAGSGSSITGTSGTGFQVGSSNATISYAGTINTTTGKGVDLTTNTGSTISFTGTMTLSSGGATAFNATGGGTVTATDTASTLISTTGTALNVANTTIGAAGLKFRSISSNGAASGIVLNSTGSSGGLTVSGTGSAGSGGTIRNGGTGISLTSTQSPSFSWMQLNDFTDFAIRGTSVVNFTLANTVISGTNGDNAGALEGDVRFTELTGTASVSNSTFSGAVSNTFAVANTTGSLNRLTISGSTFGLNSATTGDDGVQFVASGSAVLNATVQSSAFTGARGDQAQASLQAGATGSMDFVFTGNTLTDNNSIVAGGGGITAGGIAASFTFDISNNVMRDSTGNAIVVSCGGTGSSCIGKVNNNQIGLAGTANSGSTGGSGIALISAAGGTMTSAVTGNTIRQYNNHGILIQAGDIMGNPLTFNATVTSNDISTPGNINTNFNGIQLNNGTVGTDNFTSCISISANKLAGAGAGAVSPNNNDLRLRQRQATTVRLPGYGGANNDNAAVQTFLTGLQTTVTTVNASNTVPTGGGYVGGAACPTPP